MARVGRPQTAVDVLGGKIEFEIRRGGSRGGGARPPAAHRHRRDGARALPRHRLRPAGRARSRAAPWSRTGEQVTARDFLAGLPVLGESELYDEVCERLGADQRRHSGRRRSNWPSKACTWPARSARRPAAERRSMARRPRPRYSAAYDGGPDPLAPPVDLAEALDAIGERSWPATSPSGRCGSSCAAAERTGRASTTWPAGWPSAGASCCAATTSTARSSRSSELLDQAVLEERKQLAREPMDDDDRRSPRCARQPAAHHGRGGQRAGRLPLAEPRRPARTTRRSRICSVASCSTSASPE